MTVNGLVGLKGDAFRALQCVGRSANHRRCVPGDTWATNEPFACTKPSRVWVEYLQ